MPIPRWSALILCLALAMPAAAASVTVDKPAAARAPEIVVTGVKDRKRGTWKRAESDHVVLFGQDSASELTRVSRNLERIGDLATNIAEDAVFLVEGRSIKHGAGKV